MINNYTHFPMLCEQCFSNIKERDSPHTIFQLSMFRYKISACNLVNLITLNILWETPLSVHTKKLWLCFYHLPCSGSTEWTSPIRLHDSSHWSVTCEFMAQASQSYTGTENSDPRQPRLQMRMVEGDKNAFCRVVAAFRHSILWRHCTVHTCFVWAPMLSAIWTGNTHCWSLIFYKYFDQVIWSLVVNSVLQNTPTFIPFFLYL